MHSAGFLQPTLRVGRRSAAGFTLVELMVAMTGGLFLSIVVFALSRDASRFYQRESRVANATLAGLSGFERLSSDVARAGHLSTPNINNDPDVCNKPQATWPAMLQSLRAIVITTNTTASDLTEVGEAGIKPKGIIIAAWVAGRSRSIPPRLPRRAWASAAPMPQRPRT
jgi:Tfp pilus assembly protein PilW